MNPKIGKIIEENKIRQSFDYENFLAPHSLNAFKSNNFDTSAHLIRVFKRDKKKVWRNDKVKVKLLPMTSEEI